MGNEGNQETPIKKTKNERVSANQLSDSAIPIVPWNRGKTYYSRTDINQGTKYDAQVTLLNLNIQRVIWLPYLPGSICEKIFGLLSTQFLTQSIAGIGLWFKNSSPKGILWLRVYLVDAAVPGPQNITSLSAVDPIPINLADIDKEEELIIKIPPLAYVPTVNMMPGGGQNPGGLLFVLQPGPDYDKKAPVYIATQDTAPTDIFIGTAQVNQNTVDNFIIPPNLATQTPLIRIYPRLNRSISISDAEGNMLKVGAPFNCRVETVFSSRDEENHYQSQTLDLNPAYGRSGLPHTGRIRRVKLSVDFQDGTEYSAFVLKLIGKNQTLIGSENEIGETFEWIRPPSDAADNTVANQTYLEIYGDLLNVAREGMMIVKNIGNNPEYGYIIKVTTGLDIPGGPGLIQPVTRIWAINCGIGAPNALLTWSNADTVDFITTPQTIPPLSFKASKEWECNIPYQTALDNITNEFVYSIEAHCWMLGGAGDSIATIHLTLYVEEDNLLLKTNPGRSIAGSESIEEVI